MAAVVALVAALLLLLVIGDGGSGGGGGHATVTIVVGMIRAFCVSSGMWVSCMSWVCFHFVWGYGFGVSPLWLGVVLVVVAKVVGLGYHHVSLGRIWVDGESTREVGGWGRVDT